MLSNRLSIVHRAMAQFPSRLATASLPALFALGFFLSASPTSAAEPVRIAFDVPAGPATTTLPLLVAQAGDKERLIYSADALDGVVTSAVRGNYTARDAVERMLAGTTLRAVRDERTGTLAVTAAQRPTPAARPAAGEASQVVTLSTFQVNAAADVGYQAANTTSGSRLNTRLKDTAAAISPFTQEFLSDIGATSITDMLAFASNAEIELSEANQFTSSGVREAQTSNTQFRIRGQQGGISVDLAESGAPIDLFDMERVEISSGPNSILFGTGAAGGQITLSTKRANVHRDVRTVSIQAGSWNAWRTEFDLNQRLVKDRLAVRLWGLWSERDGWRQWDYENTHRLSGAVTFQPFRRTTLAASIGGGRVEKHMTIAQNAHDGIAHWRSRGATVTDGAADLVGAGTVSLGTANRYTWVQNDGNVSNLRNELISRGVPSTNARDKFLLSAKEMPYDYSYLGPGSRYAGQFDNYLLRAEQHIVEGLVVEAGYQHSASAGYATNFLQAADNVVELYGDPNLTTPTLVGGTAANSYARRLFMETNWRPETATFANDVARVTASFTRDLGKWLGSHQFAGLLENSRLTRVKNDSTEILVDQNNVPIGNTAAPENAANQLTRRLYVTEGKFDTYYTSDLRIPVAPFSVGGRTFGPRHVAFSNNATTQDRRDMDSWMLAGQSFWWNRKLVTTYGYRSDKAVYANGVTQRVNPASPLVASGERVANEWAIVPGVFNKTTDRYKTKTLGAVLHVTDRISLFYNQSDNVGAPRFDRTTVPGVRPPPPLGQGRDAGLMLDFLADGRYFARVNFFQTDTIGDAVSTPSGRGVTTNYFTSSVNAMTDYLLARGRITQAERDARNVAFDAFTLDTAARGVELEFVANPLPNWTLRATYAYSERGRTNYFAEREPFLSGIVTFIRSRDDKGVIATGRTIEQEIAELNGVIAYLDNGWEDSAQGSRPHKASLTTRYSFREGRLKGGFVGGAFLYTSPNIMQFRGSNLVVGGGAQNKSLLYGTATAQTNLFAGYDFRLRALRSKVRLQLNVNNAFDTNVVEPGLWNDTFTAYRRMYLKPPRNYRLAATFDF